MILRQRLAIQRGQVAAPEHEPLEFIRCWRHGGEAAQHRIDQREADLKKAEATGDPAKIRKAQRNLESARKVYSEIENLPL
jgi:hypothetical protein